MSRFSDLAVTLGTLRQRIEAGSYQERLVLSLARQVEDMRDAETPTAAERYRWFLLWTNETEEEAAIRAISEVDERVDLFRSSLARHTDRLYDPYHPL